MGDGDTWYIMSYDTCEMGHDWWFMWAETWFMILGGCINNNNKWKLGVIKVSQPPGRQVFYKLCGFIFLQHDTQVPCVLSHLEIHL